MIDLSSYSANKILHGQYIRLCYEGDISELEQHCTKYHLPYRKFYSLEEVLPYEIEHERDVKVLHTTSDDPDILISFTDTEIPWD